jgi:hypothetical protein
MNIHDAIVNFVVTQLNLALITEIQVSDIARAGVVIPGPLQGDPDPDVARISVSVYENDPDGFFGKNGTSANADGWNDAVAEMECGGAATWDRRFTVKARCLLVNTAENRDSARAIASTVRSRIEHRLMNLSWNSVHDDETGEYVSRGVLASSLQSEMVQAGGPPDAYDYHIKVRFEVQTTTTGVTL